MENVGNDNKVSRRLYNEEDILGNNIDGNNTDISNGDRGRDRYQDWYSSTAAHSNFTASAPTHPIFGTTKVGCTA